MIVRYLLAALAAGLLAGILMTPVQYTKAIPLILQAETFEAAGHSHKSAGEAVYAHEDTTAHTNCTSDNECFLNCCIENTIFSEFLRQCCGFTENSAEPGPDILPVQ